MRTIIVTGGRTYSDAGRVATVLGTILARAGTMRLLHGDATGADRLAAVWADLHQVESVSFPVLPSEWRRYGKAAGPMRNARMIAERPDLVVAFPGGTGTADCVAQARGAGVPVMVVPPRTNTDPA